MPVSDRKREYRRRLEGFLRDYPSVLVINVDNVGSLQLQQVRAALRGKAEVLMGKNTLIRMVIREMADSHPKVEALLPLVRKNIGLVFTKGDLSGVRDILVANRVPASAKVGIIAPCDVFVPAGPTGLDPGQTGFFQALNISTKIVRGAVEIINDVHLIKEGDKVTPSAVSLLSKLDLRPFSYGIVVQWVYENGSVYSAKALDIKASEIQGKFLRAVNKLTAVSLVIGTPNYATLPHSLANAFKKVLAIALAVDEVSFPQAEKFKLFVKDPAAYVAKYGPVGGAAPAAAPAAGAAAPAAAAAAPAKKESSSSSSMGGGGGLFGDDSD